MAAQSDDLTVAILRAKPGQSNRIEQRRQRSRERCNSLFSKVHRSILFLNQSVFDLDHGTGDCIPLMTDPNLSLSRLFLANESALTLPAVTVLLALEVLGRNRQGSWFFYAGEQVKQRVP